MKRWLITFAATFAALTLGLMAYNILLDPFGVFGDRVLDWYAYDMTMNPRVAKIAYLNQHMEDYDSFIVGNSKSSSLPTQRLNEALDASFYCMTWYGSDILDEYEIIRYLADSRTVRNIVLSVDLQDAMTFDHEADPIKDNMHCRVDGSSPLTFYGKYLLANPAYGWEKLQAWRQKDYLTRSNAVYIPELGCYNKQIRDATPIGDMEEYLAFENNQIEQTQSALPHVDQALETISAIKTLCEERGIRLFVIAVPMFTEEYYAYDASQAQAFYRGLAEITDFYDFWGSNQINSDLRYYYDTNHFRNCVGEMVMDFVLNEQTGYRPDDFGRVTTAENAEEHLQEIYSDQLPTADYTARVPILMYHSIVETDAEETEWAVSREHFAQHLQAMTDAGYTIVDYADLIAYVEQGFDLPEHPVVLSFDDGYQDNLALAAPELQAHNARATIAVIGCSVGKSTYKDSDTPITPHFALEDARPWVESGVLNIQSHSYDMHQVPELDGAECRTGVLRMEGESETDYAAKLEADYQRSKVQIESALPVKSEVFTYPYGSCDTLSEVVLHSQGIRVTVTMNNGVSELIKGIPQSLYQLKRINVPGGTTPQMLLNLLP